MGLSLMPSELHRGIAWSVPKGMYFESDLLKLECSQGVALEFVDYHQPCLVGMSSILPLVKSRGIW